MIQISTQVNIEQSLMLKVRDVEKSYTKAKSHGRYSATLVFFKTNEVCKTKIFAVQTAGL